MSEKTTRIIGWVLLDIVSIVIMFFIMFYGLNSDTLNLSIYVGMGISIIPPLCITFVLGRSSAQPSKDPVERLEEAFHYSNKLRECEERKKASIDGKGKEKK